MLSELIRSVIKSLQHEQTRTLYVVRRNERYEAWAYVGGVREFIQQRRELGELREWAQREGWEIVEI